MIDIPGNYQYSYSYVEEKKLLIATSGIEVIRLGSSSSFQGEGEPEENGDFLFISFSELEDGLYQGTWDDFDRQNVPIMGGRLLLAQTTTGFVGSWSGETGERGIFNLKKSKHKLDN